MCIHSFFFVFTHCYQGNADWVLIKKNNQKFELSNSFGDLRLLDAGLWPDNRWSDSWGTPVLHLVASALLWLHHWPASIVQLGALVKATATFLHQRAHIQCSPYDQQGWRVRTDNLCGVDAPTLPSPGSPTVFGRSFAIAANTIINLRSPAKIYIPMTHFSLFSLITYNCDSL